MENIQLTYTSSSGTILENLQSISQGQKLTVTGRYDNSVTAIRGEKGIFIEMWESPPGTEVLNLFHLTPPMTEKEAVDVFESFISKVKLGKSPQILELYIWKKGALPSVKLKAQLEDLIANLAPPPKKTEAPPQKIIGKGMLNDKIMCRFCNVPGLVYVNSGTKKLGVSGGKATAAILTGGLSLLAVGLSRKESIYAFYCSNCGSTWSTEQ